MRCKSQFRMFSTQYIVVFIFLTYNLFNAEQNYYYAWEQLR
jgi:hypothetical protein